MRVDRTTLDNGLEIIGEFNPAAKSMALGYFVRTGARDETPEVAGVSHFLEHMVFKGSIARSPEAVNREFDEIGAKYNAFTSEENTVYHGAVLPEFQSRLLGLFGDLMRPALRVGDFEMEKKVILEEIALYQDRPNFVLMEKARDLFYRDHPLGYSVLGSVESITALSEDQMLAYFRRRYAANNIRLVLAGRYDWEGAVAQAKEVTAAWESADVPRDLAPPSPRATVAVERSEKFNRAHLYFEAQGFAEQDPLLNAAEVASYAIGAARGSRLYWALKEPGLVDTIWFGHDGKDGSGTFVGYASCDVEHVQQVADTLRQVVDEARVEGVTEKELVGARRKMAAGRTLHAETPMGRLMSVGMDWVYRREVTPLDEEIDRTLAVTAEEANRSLQSIRPEETVLVGLGPFEALH